jgi:prepilin-type N-terminal cleavage/methylation domain-containing protein
MTAPTKRKRSAFTLLELIITIVVLGVIAGLSVPVFTSVIAQSKSEVAQAEASTFARKVNALATFEDTTLSDAISTTVASMGGASYSTGSYTSSNGCVVSVTEGVRSVTVGSATCPGASTIAVGDIGPAGGIVIYDAGSTQTWGRYIEAAPVTWIVESGSPGSNYGCGGIETGAIGTAVGTGLSNTNTLIGSEPACVVAGSSAPYTALLAAAYSGGGATNWHLPSKDELNLIWQNINLFPGIDTAGAYLSSSETGLYSMWIQSLSSGFQADLVSVNCDPSRGGCKNALMFNIHPVRYFG